MCAGCGHPRIDPTRGTVYPSPLTMDKHRYPIEVHPADPDEGGGFWVSIPELEGCFTQGDTYEQALSRAHDAILCHSKALARADRKFRRIRDVRDL